MAYARHSKVFDENKLEIPAGLYYDRTHTWPSWKLTAW